MKYLIGAGIVLAVQVLVIACCREFYLHVAPNDNVIQFDGTVIELKGLNVR